MLNAKSLRGLWSRTLLLKPGEVPDRTSHVFWLQSRTFFIDLRQPHGRPNFSGVRGFGDLEPQHIAWMAGQEGFAGTLHLEEDVAEWRRDIDFQPPAATRDRGRLALTGDSLEERGVDADYLEEWRRESVALSPCTGLSLQDPHGAAAYFVRVAQTFMFARPRKRALPPGGTLSEHIGGLDDFAAVLDLLDFEISFGRVENASWHIHYSTLPFREGCRFNIAISGPELQFSDGITWEIKDTDRTSGDTGEDLARAAQALMAA